jgi:hypothetical protein
MAKRTFLTDKDEKGFVKSVNGKTPDENGNVEIEVPEGGNANCLLTVETITIGEPGEPGNIQVTGIVLDYSNISLDVGDSMMLAASVLPSNATNNIVLWESSNNDIATVDNGYVTAVGEGNAVITAKSDENNSIKATCSVAVVDKSGGDTPDIPDIPDTPVEPTDGKIMFSTLAPVKEGVLLKNDGKTEFADAKAKGYYQLPYSDGMKVSTVMQSGWVANYPPFLIVNNGVATIPEYSKTDASPNTTIYPNFTTTLTGLSNTAVIYANVAYLVGALQTDEMFMEHCYYIVGGAA